jgi:PAS domain S-box-containing protein
LYKNKAIVTRACGKGAFYQLDRKRLCYSTTVTFVFSSEKNLLLMPVCSQQPFLVIQLMDGQHIMKTNKSEFVDHNNQDSAARKMLELAFEIGDMGNFFVDLSTNMATFSPRIANWLNIPEGKASLVELTNKVHPDDQEKASTSMNAAIAGEQHGRREIVYRLAPAPDANYRYVRSIGQVQYENGKAVSIVGVMQDVTEQTLAQQRIAESEARFRHMAENTDVLIATGDDKGNAIFFNKAWTNLTGRPMEALLNMGWLDLIHPDDKDLFFTVGMDAWKIKGPYSAEFRVRGNDGTYHWLLTRSTPRFSAEGAFIGYISSCNDITNSKLHEQRLERALQQAQLSKEAAQLGIFDMDLETATLHWDERCRILFGISHQQPVTYEKDFVEGLHPDDRERIIEIIDKAFIKSVSNGDYDVEYRTVGVEDGVIRWVRAKGKVYFNAEEKPVRFIGSVLDITEQVNAMHDIERTVEERTKELAQAYASLQDINKELERSNEQLEEFAHAASHDLKEPIRKIQFFTNQLKNQVSGQINEQSLKLLQRIEMAGHRMARLVDDLLVYSHVSTKPHHKEVVNLNDAIKNVLEDLELDIQEKTAIVEIAQLPDVTGYRRQLQQLFQNLVSNALKYSSTERRPHITIKNTRLQENGTHYHCIEVVDNGIGFEQEYARKIFEMFVRLHGKNEYEGTGIGLAIVKKVVENHDGFIQAASEPDKGARFAVYLPV